MSKAVRFEELPLGEKPRTPQRSASHQILTDRSFAKEHLNGKLDLNIENVSFNTSTNYSFIRFVFRCYAFHPPIGGNYFKSPDYIQWI